MHSGAAVFDPSRSWSPNVPAMSGRLGYRPALDGLRGVAIAMVVGLHAFHLPQTGTLGVDLFFVLSGFLITTLLFEEHDSRGRVSLVGFYSRRVRRLYPALSALVAVYFVWTTVGHTENVVINAERSFVGFTYLTNIALAMNQMNLVAAPLTHLWSLAAEEQFYVLWPPILLLIGFRRRVALVILAAATLIFLARQLWLINHVGPSFNHIAYGPDIRSPTSILIGCLVAVVYATDGRRALASFSRYAWIPSGIGCLILAFIFLPTIYDGWITLFSALAAIVLVQALDSTSVLARGLSTPPLVWLGKISYSLYLWHVAIIAPLHFPRSLSVEVGAVAASLALASASYYLVEQPFRRRRTASRADDDGVTRAPRPAERESPV